MNVKIKCRLCARNVRVEEELRRSSPALRTLSQGCAPLLRDRPWTDTSLLITRRARDSWRVRSLHVIIADAGLSAQRMQGAHIAFVGNRMFSPSLLALITIRSLVQHFPQSSHIHGADQRCTDHSAQSRHLILTFMCCASKRSQKHQSRMMEPQDAFLVLRQPARQTCAQSFND